MELAGPLRFTASIYRRITLFTHGGVVAKSIYINVKGLFYDIGTPG